MDSRVTPGKSLGATTWGEYFPPIVHAALTGAILLGDPKEVAALGGAYTVPGPDIERLPIPRLRELADAQRHALFSPAWTKTQVQDTLRAAVEAAIREAQ